mgnify:CR=1 FL=1|jgi:hypothetical protein
MSICRINDSRRCIRLFLIGAAFLAAACSTSKETRPESTGIDIDGVIIRNELAFPVTEVQILVPSSGNFVGCGNILGRSECSTTFPVSDYHANEVVISWKEYGQPNSTGPFVIQTPEDIDISVPVRLEVIIFNMGHAGARLVQ